MIPIVQFAFLIVALVFVALLAFALLVVYEQVGICSSSTDKLMALLSSAIGTILGTQILIGSPIPPLLLIAFLSGGLLQIWFGLDR